jgi:hypothetical protein
MRCVVGHIVCGAALLSWGCSAGFAQESQASKEQDAVRLEIVQISQHLRRDPSTVSYERLKGIADQIASRWKERDARTYGLLTLAFCQAVQSSNVLPRMTALSQRCALSAVALGDALPIDLVCELLQCAQHNLDENGKALTGTPLSESRRDRVKRWLRALQRIQDAIDPRFDANDVGYGNVMPPGGAGPAGMDPAGISDPVVRAQYLSAIQANQDKIVKASFQLKLRDLQKEFFEAAIRFILFEYSDVPAGPKEVDELMEAAIKDATLRARLDTALHARRSGEPRGPATRP